jgi:hypothetical protein
MASGGVEIEHVVESDPDPLEIEFLEIAIRREASAATGLGDEVELAISSVRAEPSSPASAAGRGVTAASSRASGLTSLRGRVSAVASSPRPKRRRASRMHPDDPFHVRVPGRRVL